MPDKADGFSGMTWRVTGAFRDDTIAGELRLTARPGTAKVRANYQLPGAAS
jgi:hypothetical protein